MLLVLEPELGDLALVIELELLYLHLMREAIRGDRGDP
jgi:hypothetical protein